MKLFSFGSAFVPHDSPQTSARSGTTLFGLLVTLGFAALPISRWLDEFASTSHLLAYELIWWAIGAFVIGYVLMVEKRPLSSIGLRRPSAGLLGQGVAFGLLTVLGLALIYFAVLPALHLNEHGTISQLKATPGWWLFISTVRAAVVEELMFRGYALERLNELTRNLPLAAGITWAIFTLEHVGTWGWSHLIVAGFGGLMLTWLYLRCRNLWVVMLAHFIVDGLSLLAA